MNTFFENLKFSKKKIDVTILVYFGLLNWGKIFVLLKKVFLTPKGHLKGQKCRKGHFLKFGTLKSQLPKFLIKIFGYNMNL